VKSSDYFGSNPADRLAGTQTDGKMQMSKCTRISTRISINQSINEVNTTFISNQSQLTTLIDLHSAISAV